jgi:hypothetical protein
LLDDLGLAAALDWLCHQQAQRSGITIAFDTTPLPMLPPDLTHRRSTASSRKGITNALKHATASQHRHRRPLLTTTGSNWQSSTMAAASTAPNIRPGVSASPACANAIEALGGRLGLRERGPVKARASMSIST